MTKYSPPQVRDHPGLRSIADRVVVSRRATASSAPPSASRSARLGDRGGHQLTGNCTKCSLLNLAPQLWIQNSVGNPVWKSTNLRGSRRGTGPSVGVMVSLAILTAACEQEVIRVDPMPAADNRHIQMIAAIDTFIAAKRGPAAYADLASKIATLRPGMDAALAREAERRMLVLALVPVKALADKPIGHQVDALALTVWPTLLAPPIAADALLSVADPKALEIRPKANEEPQQYLLRLCFGPLASECKRAVPEFHGNIVAALAARRATERVRTAIADCLECSSDSSDPGWRDAVKGWEQIDRSLAADVPATESRSHPDNWPKAGAAAEDDPGLPEAEVRPRGELVVGGYAYGPNRQRIAVLRELRGKANVIALHFHPDTSLERVRAVLIDARKAGCDRVAVIAREPVYPYRRRVYYAADGYGLRANLRPTDTLQLLLHSIDEVAGPGTVARVD